MNCDCISKCEKKIVEEQPFKKKRLIIKSARIKSSFGMSGNTIIRVPMLEAELEIEGRRTTKKIEIAYEHCPFCGEKLRDEDALEKSGK